MRSGWQLSHALGTGVYRRVVTPGETSTAGWHASQPTRSCEAPRVKRVKGGSWRNTVACHADVP